MASSQTDAIAQAGGCASTLAPPAGALAGGLRSSPSIARQTSIYALTLDELQNVLGEPTKSFGSMNMDEFLKNIWTFEESQAMAAAMGGSGGIGLEGMPRQASISLPRTLSKKTVDDVLKDVVRGSIEMDSNPILGGANVHERQVTLGEMTLEDFLVQAGVVQKDSGSAPLGSFAMSFANPPSGAPSVSNNNQIGDMFGGMKGSEGEKPRVAMPSLSGRGANMSVSQGAHASMRLETMNHGSPRIHPPEWLPNNTFKEDINYTHPPMNHPFNQHALEVNARNGVVNGAVIGGLGMLGSEASLALKTESPQSPMVDGLTTSYDFMSLHSPLPHGADGFVRGRKRDFDGSLEKVIERRQKRMIKNRESAARSRARKQAYTVELEAEVSHLKQENMRLRQYEEELAERRRRQLIDVLNSFGPQFKQKACRLRRTHTGPW